MTLTNKRLEACLSQLTHYRTQSITYQAIAYGRYSMDLDSAVSMSSTQGNILMPEVQFTDRDVVKRLVVSKSNETYEKKYVSQLKESWRSENLRCLDLAQQLLNEKRDKKLIELRSYADKLEMQVSAVCCHQFLLGFISLFIPLLLIETAI